MTRSWIHFTRGRFVRQARVGLGDLREEHLSRQGFAGPVAMLYRTDGPNEVVRFEGDYRPRQIDSADVVADASDTSRRDARRWRSRKRKSGSHLTRCWRKQSWSEPVSERSNSLLTGKILAICSSRPPTSASGPKFGSYLKPL
jgi:hypothetical protein